MSKTTHIIEHDVHTIIEEEDREEVGARTGKRRRLFPTLAATVAVPGGGYYAYAALGASPHVEAANDFVRAIVDKVTTPVEHVRVLGRERQWQSWENVGGG